MTPGAAEVLKVLKDRLAKVRRDRDRVQFRQYLLDGIDAKPVGRMDATYFAALRRRLKIRG